MPYPRQRRPLLTTTAALLGIPLALTACNGGGLPPGATPTALTPGTKPLPQPTLPALQQVTSDLTIGGPGAGPGSFNEPGGLVTDSEGNLYATDIMNHRVQKFDANGDFVAQVGGNGPGQGQFHEPWGIAIDSEGNVYVADTFNHRIQKFDADLNFVLAFGTPASNLQTPEPQSFWGPRDVAVDPAGNVWIADSGTGRVVKYDPDGKLLQAFGGMGSGQGQFQELTSIELAPGGDIFVADSGNRRVQRFDANFTFLAEYPVPGWLYVDSVVKPYLALLPDGGFIVSDPTQNKLFRFDAQGKATATLDAADSPLAVPRGLAFDRPGYIFVSEAEPDHVRRFPLKVPAPP